MHELCCNAEFLFSLSSALRRILQELEPVWYRYGDRNDRSFRPQIAALKPLPKSLWSSHPCGDGLLVTCLRSLIWSGERRRCRAAGDEYRHFSHLVYSFCDVLRTVERELQRPGSVLTRRESETFVLAETIADCVGILEIVRDRLERYQRTHSLSCLRRTWDRVRFGVADVAANLSPLETRLTTKIAIIILLLNLFKIPVVAQVQTTPDTTRQEINHGIAGIQSTLYDIARQLPQRRFPKPLNSESSVEEGWSHTDAGTYQSQVI
jgi:hypothetical protein